MKVEKAQWPMGRVDWSTPAPRTVPSRFSRGVASRSQQLSAQSGLSIAIPSPLKLGFLVHNQKKRDKSELLISQHHTFRPLWVTSNKISAASGPSPTAQLLILFHKFQVFTTLSSVGKYSVLENSA
jgi:hypothetical protein